MFKNLQLNNWRQFESVNIDFHPRLTIITGANGAGKTTILNLINRHFGWNAYADETDPLSPLEIDPLELIGFLGQKSGSSSGLI